ncbi:MAG: hypothetical protein OEZ65_09800 [Gemmatimonadota bacterium]|nr:hypothetical protein [Gemmatimonadota bacterium]MDH5759870.1 hypothetical protein [Gemmatimonadota bacterium]
MTSTAVRETLTGLGVVLSLVFVAFEIRANTDAVRGATIQGIADQYLAITLASMGTAEVRSGWAKAAAGRMDELTVDEEIALNWYYNGILRIAENRFRQVELSIIELEVVSGGAPEFRSPFFKSYWESRRSLYTDDFATHVDKYLLPLATDSVYSFIPRSVR